MKIQVNGEFLFELTDLQKKVIKNDIHDDIFDRDMKRRLFYILNHKYNQCFKRLKDEWEPKLAANGVRSIPTDKDELAALIFSQPNYKNRKQRQEEAVGVE